MHFDGVGDSAKIVCMVVITKKKNGDKRRREHDNDTDFMFSKIFFFHSGRRERGERGKSSLDFTIQIIFGFMRVVVLCSESG